MSASPRKPSSSAVVSPSGAGMTPLPPSPEIKPSSSQLSELDASVPLFTLGSLAQPTDYEERAAAAKSRLRSVAKYQTFSPQALACSDPIPATTYASSSSSTLKYSSGTTDSNQQQQQTTDGNRLQQQQQQNRRHSPSSGGQDPQASSLGAVAGSQGVVVFRISKPHEPLMTMNHATSNRQHAAGGRPVTALAFQPDTTSSLYLAAARGSGVLLWDVSGHSLSPLLGRLAMDSSSTVESAAECVTTSLCWKLSQERDGIPLLATTTATSACIWDLRCPVASAKPSVRFGGASASSSSSTTRKSTSNSNLSNSHFRQIACSRSHECAILDTAGIVRVYDVRMTEKSRFGANPLTSFTAFGHAGVGISYLPLMASGTGTTMDQNYSTTAWVTWGIDSPDTDAVVKVWSSYSSNSNSDSPAATKATDENDKRAGSATIPENYWFMDGSPGRSSGSIAPYRLIAQCNPPYGLACPRVCPAPVENGILTIGILGDHHGMGGGGGRRGGQGWRAELWKVRPPAAFEIEANHGTFGMEKVIAFDGGADRDKGIVSAIGKETKIGKLKAAELAITPYNLLAGGVNAAKHDDERSPECAGMGLALCCLSDNGFVTTHMISEALPKKLSNQMDGASSLSPQRSTLFPNGRPKVFADEREAVAMDAARLWGGQGERSNRPTAASEARSSVELLRNAQASPTMEGGLTAGGPPQQSSRHNDGAMAPLFEMDVPAVAYGNVTTGGISGVQIGPIDLTSPKVPATSALVEETDNTAADVRDVAAMAERMDNIETERIPCPRLCGATFGPGVGGLAMFKNGDVKKMWLWYDRAGSSSRLAAIPSSIIAPEQAFSGPRNSTKGGGIESHETVDLKMSMPRDSPRTMKDLMDMVSAAKEAQWGEVNNEGDAETNDQEQSSGGDNFFEYMSTGSISSESDNEIAEFGNVEISLGKGSRSIYENYFGKFHRPVAQPSGGNSKKTEEDGQPSESSRTGSPVAGGKVQVVGPSSDTLAPSVHVTHDYDKIALNNQSAELAKEWELGQWQGDYAGSCPSCDIERLPKRAHYSELNLLNANGFRESVNLPQDSQLAHRGLPSYRGLASSPTKPGQVTRPKSDPLLAAMVPRKKVQIENEPGVHGGEYAVRPNMQESMVFLRKLFSHQQQDGNQFPPTLLSPPDSPMVNTRPKSTQNPVPMSQFSAKPTAGSSENRSKVLPGVYALSSDTQGQILHDDDKNFRQIRSICIHNAEVCERLGEIGKQGVWKLLAQMVDRRLNEPADAFNGWGGKGGGALGVDLVASFMRYYEALGDCQMLATMVCVLKEGNHSFLPEGQDEKYDTYIRCYSDLLFGWGLLEKRAELNKHLVQRVQESEGRLLNGNGANEQLPGIALVFACPKCGREAEFGTNICRSCQEFAFKCSICENAVRGLYTVCDACGHGGHVGHMTSWFSKHAQCPSGCGCFCTFTTHPQRRSVTEVNAPSRGDAAGLGSFLPLDPLDA